jgi:flagellar hook protein FlgE
MDVIGNNIANVNTTAFKSSSIVFNELLSQTTQKASGPNASTGAGGINARQIGLGVRGGAIDANISGQGASQTTGDPFDVMITGSSLFIVNNGTENCFTRDGSFYVDAMGNLAMSSTGYNVMGWGVNELTGDIQQNNVSALRIMSVANLTYPPEATTQGVISGILDRNDEEAQNISGKIVNLNFYDNLGYQYTAKLSFKQSDDPSTYSVEFVGLQDSEGNSVDIDPVEFGNPDNAQERESTMGFDSSAYVWNGMELQAKDGTVLVDITQMVGNGALLARDTVTTTPLDASGQMMTVGDMIDNLAKAHGYEGSTDEFLNLYQNYDHDGNPVSDPQEITVKQMIANMATGTNPVFPQLNGATNTAQFNGRHYEGTTVSFNKGDGSFMGIGGIATQETVALKLEILGENFRNIDLNLSTMSSVNNGGTSTANADKGDLDGMGVGRKLGSMIGVSVQNSGLIYGSYDNGMTKLLGQIAVAEFPNVSGLEKLGDNIYGATLNSGEFDGVGVDISVSGGYMSSGQLEMSNVDLSQEFTEMITTQRGFQANSRIITVSDTLLEELTNLKR